MKDAQVCDKFGRVDKRRYYSKISEWGNPMRVIRIICFYRWTQCELKYLSSIGKEINLEIPLVVTSERGTA